MLEEIEGADGDESNGRHWLDSDPRFIHDRDDFGANNSDFIA